MIIIDILFIVLNNLLFIKFTPISYWLFSDTIIRILKISENISINKLEYLLENNYHDEKKIIKYCLIILSIILGEIILFFWSIWIYFDLMSIGIIEPYFSNLLILNILSKIFFLMGSIRIIFLATYSIFIFLTGLIFTKF